MSSFEKKLRILNETKVKKAHINKLSNTKFRVFLGPYNNLNYLKNSFNAINVLQFDNIEIIKKLSDTNFRVFLGPYIDLNSLKNSFNAINVLQFDSLEVIKK